MTINRAGEEVRATLPLAEEQRRAMADAAVAAFMRAIELVEQLPRRARLKDWTWRP